MERNLPPVVRVGPFDVQIVGVSTRESFSRARCGEFSSTLLRITMDADAPAQKLVDTLWHEIMHAVYWAYNLRDGDDEERMCATLASALTQIHRDNSEMIRLMLDMTALGDARHGNAT